MTPRTAALLAVFVSLASSPAVTVPSSARAQSTVLISELCDPRLNYLTDRFLEIANVGAHPVDLTGWSLVAVGNGAKAGG